MDITFRCPECGQQFVVEEKGAGITIDCPACGCPVGIPQAASAAAPSRIQPAATRGTIPAVTGGVICLLILVMLCGGGFLVLRHDLAWLPAFLGAAAPFGLMVLVCGAYAVCRGQTQHGILLVAGLAVTVGLTARVICDLGLAAWTRRQIQHTESVVDQIQQIKQLLPSAPPPPAAP